MKRWNILIIPIVLLLFLNNCSLLEKPRTQPQPIEPQPRERLEPPEKSTAATESKSTPAKTRRLPGTALKNAPVGEIIQTGMASWYGEQFHGRRTANGEIYDMYKMTAAHQTLPFNTLLQVENLNNGKNVVVRINDRGPFKDGRILDLSYQAARRLGSDADGVAPVTLRIKKAARVSRATSPPAVPRETISVTEVRSNPQPQPPELEKEAIEETAVSAPPEPSSAGSVSGAPGTVEGHFFLQAGAFGEEDNAAKVLRNIAFILPNETFRIDHENGLYKVRSGRLPSREKAEALKKILLDIDIEAFIKAEPHGVGDQL